MSGRKIENTVHLVLATQLDMILCIGGRHCCSSTQSVLFPHISTGLILSAGNISCPCLKVAMQSLDTSEIKEYLTYMPGNWWYFCQYTHLLWENFNSLINDCSCLMSFITGKVSRNRKHMRASHSHRIPLIQRVKNKHLKSNTNFSCLYFNKD